MKILNSAVTKNLRIIAASTAFLLMSVAAQAGSIPDELAQKGIALINSMEPGDGETFLRLTSPKTYVQHSAHSPDGQAATFAMYPMVKGKVHAKVARAFQDGEFAVIHADLNMFGKDLVTFQIWRFESGLAVEHWDATQPKSGPNPDGNSMSDGSTEVTDLDKTDANKAVVKGLLENVFIGGKFDQVSTYISDSKYIQHDSMVANGLEGLQKASTVLKDFHMKAVKRILGQGNFVLAASQATFNGADIASYDLFRLENSKIVEHWDVLASIAPPSEWKNRNGMF